MSATLQLNPEIWEFWRRTHNAWASGQLASIDSTFQDAAVNSMDLEHFIDYTTSLVAALRALKPRDDEFLYCYSPGDCDAVLTNQRLMVRNCKTGWFNIHELSDIERYSHSGWSAKIITLTFKDGTIGRYAKLGGALTDDAVNHAMSSLAPAQAPTKTIPLAKSATPQVECKETELTQPALTANITTTTTEQTGGRPMSESEMIGSEYPALQQVIKKRLQPEEKVLAFATAVTTPTGNVHWVPVVGALLELGRAAATKPYILAVTDRRFLIIQINKFSHVTKEVNEVAFVELPIERIRAAAAESRFLDSLVYGDSFKLDAGEGRKYHFRKLTKQHASMLRDAILLAKSE